MGISNFIFIPTSLTIILNILPILSFINFFSNKTNFETIPISRMISNYINSLSFFFYSSIIFNIELRFANLISAIISFVLIIIYFYLELSRYCLDSVLNFIILIMGTSCCHQWLSKIIIEEIYVGRIYIVTYLTTLFIQMQHICKGINKKNYLLIPITYDSISIPAYFSWIVYGILLKDFYISTANIIYCVFYFIQIIIYFHYKREYISNINYETSIDIDDTKKGFSSMENMKERPVKIEINSY